MSLLGSSTYSSPSTPLWASVAELSSIVSGLSTVNVSTATAAGVTVAETSPNNFVFTNALTNAGGIAFVQTPGSTSLGLSNAGVTGLVAGTGVTVSGATGNVTVANTGVLSVTAGTNVTLGGSASAPVINASASLPAPTYLLNQWASSPLTVTTPAGGEITVVSSFTGLTPFKTYLAQCTVGVSGNGTDPNKDMDVAFQIPDVGELPSICSFPFNQNGSFGAYSAFITMPSSATQLNVIVSGFNTAGGDTVTAQVENLAILPIN